LKRICHEGALLGVWDFLRLAVIGGVDNKKQQTGEDTHQTQLKTGENKSQATPKLPKNYQNTCSIGESGGGSFKETEREQYINKSRCE